MSIVLDAPTTSTDFSKTAIDILGHVTVATGTTLKSVQVIYDGAAIASQAAAGNTITFKAWNPSIANSLGTPQDTTPVPFGPHTLLLRAVTSTGATVDSSELDFDKPLIFRGWKNTTSVNGSDVTIPNLTSPRTGMPLYATHGFLFGFFGDGENGLPAPGVISLSLLGLATPTWSPHAAPGLTWRHHVALAGSDATVYLVGGQPSAGQQQPGAAPGLAAPTVRADAFDLFNHTALQLPDLPQAVTDAGAAIVNHYLYVVAGTTTGAATDATRRVFRLALAADDTPSATAQWEERSPLPVPLRGAAAAVGGGRLFVMGGQAPDGSRRESVYAYDAAGDAWQRVQIMPMAVSDGTAADFGGSIYYFGGYGADGAPSQNTFRFDYGNTALGMPVRAFGAGAPNLPSARALAGVAVLTDQEHGQRLFVAGGETTGPNGIGPIPDVAMGDTL